MYHFARAIDIDGVNVARVDVPDLPEYKVILAHFLRAHPDIPPDLMFEGRDSLAMAGNVSWALNRRYLRWWPAYRPAKTSRDFYPLPFRPIGPSPQQIYWAYWDLMNWFTDSRTVRGDRKSVV